MRKTLSTLLIVIVGTLLGTAGTAHGGGWAVVALDPLAESPVEGRPVSVGFTILQHGVTPYTTSNASIIVTDATGRIQSFAAKPAGEPGHHITQVTFPGTGVYRWDVQPDWFPKQSLGEINVENAAPGTPPTTVANASGTSVAPPSTAATATIATTTTTTTVREPLALALRITLAVAFGVALTVAVAEFVTARRRSLA